MDGRRRGMALWVGDVADKMQALLSLRLYDVFLFYLLFFLLLKYLQTLIPM